MANYYNSDGIGADGLSILAMSLLWDIPGAIVYDSATITWRVERWNTTTSGVRSPYFLCNGVKWRLLCYPQGSPASARGSVSLYLDRGNFGQTTNLPAICAQFSLIISNPGDPSIFTHQSVAKRINPGELLCGFENFCTSTEVEQATQGNSTSILSRGEVDVTVFLRVMYDPADVLWLLGVPLRPSSAEPVSSESSLTSPPTNVNGNKNTNVVAGPSSGKVTTTSEVPAKPLPPCRAAYPGEECIICADEPLLFPQKSPTEVCQHSGGICLPCLQTHISAEIGGKGGADGVVCPAPDCAEILNYHEIKYWADGGTFARYDRMLTRRALGVEEGFVMCTNAKCEAGQIHSEGASAPIVTCYVCHHRTCFTHQVAWHEGYTCEEWDRHQATRIGTATTEEYLTKFTKMCPRCKKTIEKSEGCDAMTCKLPVGCGHTFCWMCLAPYDVILRDGNHRHHPHCKHYAAYDGPRVTRSLSTPDLLYDFHEAEEEDPVPRTIHTINQTTVASTSATLNAHHPYTVGSTSVSTPSVHRSNAEGPTSMSRSSYWPPPYVAAGTPSTSQGASQPPLCTTGSTFSAGGTRKPARRWYRFWKD